MDINTLTFVLKYLLPIPVVFTIILLLGEYALRRVILNWNILLVVLAGVVGFLLLPPYALWIIFISIVSLAGFELWKYQQGPSDIHAFVFLGFFGLSESGKLRRQRRGIVFESDFNSTLTDVVQQHRVSSQLGTHTIDHRLPIIAFPFVNHDDIDAYAERLSQTNLGVIWGILDETGSLEHFRIVASDNRIGLRYCLSVLDDLRPLYASLSNGSNQSTVTATTLARIVGAVVGMSYTDELNEEGQWRDAVYLTSDSQDILKSEATLQERREHSTKHVTSYIQEQLVPLARRQRALALATGGQYRQALDELYPAIDANPKWPLSTLEEYDRYYRDKYTLELIEDPHFTHFVEPELVSQYTPEWKPLSNADLFMDLLIALTQSGNVPQSEITQWFKSLQNRHSDNPWMMMYWGDAIRLIGLHSPGNHDRLPAINISLDFLLAAIQKYEVALEIRPSLNIINSRVAALYMHAMLAFPVGSQERDKYEERFRRHVIASGGYWQSSLPSSLISQVESPSIASSNIGRYLADLDCHPQLNRIPPRIADFINRVEEMDNLFKYIDTPAEQDENRVVVVTGVSGIGKTAFTTQAAHRFLKQYRGTVLWVSLRDLGGKPREPKEALVDLLKGFGVEEQAMPSGTKECRDLLQITIPDKRTLIVLEDAENHEAIEGLILHLPGCITLITRNEMDDLGIQAKEISLGPLSLTDGVAFLQKAIDQAIQNPDDAEKIVELCQGNPLSLQIAGGTIQAELYPSTTAYISALADELRALSPDPRNDPSAVIGFLATYLRMGQAEASLFRLFGFIPRTPVTLESISALLGEDPETAHRIVNHLVELQLLIPVEGDRYRMHNALRGIAWPLLQQQVDPYDRTQAMARFVGSYIQTTEAMSEKLIMGSRSPEHAVSHREAITWFDWEVPFLLELMHALGKNNEPGALSIAINLRSFLDLRGSWSALKQAQQLALDIARKIDPDAITLALSGLGTACARLGQWEEALDAYDECLEIYRSVDDQQGEAQTLMNLGNIYHELGRWDNSRWTHEGALELLQRLADYEGQASVLTNLGNLYLDCREWDRSLEAHQDSLAIHEENNDEHGKALSLANLGNVYLAMGNWDDAIRKIEQAIEIFKDIGDRNGEATGLLNLGSVYFHRGPIGKALLLYDRSIELLQGLGNQSSLLKAITNVAGVYAKMDRLDEAISKYLNALEFAERLGDLRMKMAILHSLGLIYGNLNRIDDAEEMFQTGLDVARVINDEDVEAQMLINLGTARYHQGKQEEAVNLWKQARAQVDRHSPDDKRIQELINNANRSTDDLYRDGKEAKS